LKFHNRSAALIGTSNPKTALELDICQCPL
jgi:hypothetical protein